MIDSSNIALPERPSYGAVEVKAFIKKATWRAFFITIALLILLALINFLVVKIQSYKPEVKMPPKIQLKIDNIQQTEDVSAAPPPPDVIINNGPAVRAGSPVPVPDALIAPDMKEIATVDVQSRASSIGGDGVDLGEMAANVDVNRQVEMTVKTEEEPDINAFIAVEQEPGVDLGELQKKIVYPDVAKKAGIEGRVTIRVLVGKDGKPKKCEVEASDSEVLNRAAKDAVMKSVFTPAVQNGSPTTCWVSIPINFKLR